MTLKCGECDRVIPKDDECRKLDDDLVILYCPVCKLTFTIAIDVSTAEVTHDIDDALTDVYWG